jgi:hypothetical protein
MTRQKHLSSREKKKILTCMASGMSANTVAKQLKRNRRTVAKFLDEPATKMVLADMFERTARQALERIGPEKLEKSSALQLATVAGISTDKMRLLRNEPTQISVDYLLAAVTDIRAMRAAQNPPRPQLPPSPDQKES